LALPAQPAIWAPSPADLTALGVAGRALVAELLGRYDLAAVEGRVLLEAGRAADVLATLRAVADPDAAALRLEQVWSRHLAVLLGQLHVERT
jgi:hypothetical protein